MGIDGHEPIVFIVLRMRQCISVVSKRASICYECINVYQCQCSHLHLRSGKSARTT